MIQLKSIEAQGQPFVGVILNNECICHGIQKSSSQQIWLEDRIISPGPTKQVFQLYVDRKQP